MVDALSGASGQSDAAARRTEATAKAKERTKAGDSLYGEYRYADAEAAYREAVPPELATSWRITASDASPEYRAAPQKPKPPTVKPSASTPAARLQRTGGRPTGYSAIPEAEAAFREAVRLNPGNFHGYNGLGTVLYDVERYSEAEAAYREAIRALPDNAYAYDRPWERPPCDETISGGSGRLSLRCILILTSLSPVAILRRYSRKRNGVAKLACWRRDSEHS